MDTSTDRAAGTARPVRLLRAAWPVPAVVWFVVPPFLTWQGFGTSLAFFGESPTPAEVVMSRHYYVAAAATAVGLALVGLVGARFARSLVGTVLCTTLLVVGCAFGSLVALDVHRASVRDQPPAPRVTTCQEHSGGDTRCPGG